jgi:hypothetical protein
LRNESALAKTSFRDLSLLSLLTVVAFFVHGYHPAAEDAAIYLPGIKKLLHPDFYPYNDQFFAAHASRTLFPRVITTSIKITHIPFDNAILFWHLLSIFLLLLACWRIASHCFPESAARWGAVLLVGATLTVPVAGTALFILDPYLNPRSLSAPAILFGIVNALEGRYVRTTLWLIATALIHPLMAVFGISYLLALQLPRLQKSLALGMIPLVFLHLGLLQPIGSGYRDSLDIPAHSFFFLLRWQWYEWVGIFAPIALLFFYRAIARRNDWRSMARLASALIVYGLAFFAAALVLTVPKGMAGWVFLQPMRSLHLLYILFFLFTGGMLGHYVLQRSAWRWLLLFLPLCGGMYFVQRQTFPSTPHVEWPGVVPANDWLQAFSWIREHTPQDAYFALDPDHMGLPGEDEHGFRALAERSMLADRVKDSGAVTMFPRMAEDWQRQVQAQAGWKDFQRADFERLRQDFGVTWFLVQRAGGTGLTCVYENPTLKVCRLDRAIV